MRIPEPRDTDVDGPVISPSASPSPARTSTRAPAPLPQPPADLAVFLGPEATVQGTLSLAGDLRLEGTLDGELLGAGHVTVGPTARVTGRISARTVIILGARVEAEIRASEAIELREGAYVKGDLRAPHIHIDPDIEFHGRCDMTPHTRPPGPTIEGDPP